MECLENKELVFRQFRFLVFEPPMNADLSKNSLKYKPESAFICVHLRLIPLTFKKGETRVRN
jgi:hypothetical protein